MAILFLVYYIYLPFPRRFNVNSCLALRRIGFSAIPYGFCYRQSRPFSSSNRELPPFQKTIGRRVDVVETQKPKRLTNNRTQPFFRHTVTRSVFFPLYKLQIT